MAELIDRGALAEWIQPQHLEDGTLAGGRRAFAEHPARLVWLRDFLDPGIADRLGTFLAKEAEFRNDYGLYSVEGSVSEEQWAAADEPDRFFRLGKIAGTPPEFRLSPNALTYLRFRQAFQGPMRGFFQALTGIALGPSDDFGSHRMVAGDFLRPHSDDNRDRRVALVIYLSADWDSSAGGALEVRDSGGGVTTVQPEFNSVVVFDVLAETLHAVPTIPTSVGARSRLTIGGWYPRPG